MFTHCDVDNLDAILASDAAPKSLRERWLPRLAGAVGVDNDQRLVARARLQTALDGLVARLNDERYSHDALREAQKRRDAAREEDRAAFRAAVLDWRKRDGPLVVERPGRPVEKDKGGLERCALGRVARSATIVKREPTAGRSVDRRHDCSRRVC